MNCTIKFFRSILISLIFMLTGMGLLGAESSLTVWDFKYTDHRTEIAINRIDNLFRKSNPDITLIHKGFFDQEYIPALRAALLAGTGPDILWLHMGPELAENQPYLESLDDFLDNSGLLFRSASLDYCRDDTGALKALPLTFQGIGWYYNKELFRSVGLDPENPPDDWYDFLIACKTLKNQGITPIAMGNNRPMTTEFLRRSLITAFFTEEEIESFYDQGQGPGTERFRMILAFGRELRDKGYFDESGVYRPYFNYASDSFSQGKSAMILGLLSDIAHWKNFTDSLGRENVGYFPNLIHPGMKRPGAQLLQDAGVLVAINKASENKEAASLYLNHLFSGESQEILTEDLGMLIPLEESVLPVDDYPLLEQIYHALQNTGTDPEMSVPSNYIKDLQYRLDDLLINSREITINEYLKKFRDELKLY
ncbi:MAG: extracellular solute-binding protein [Spirochaetales bacterium]|nr:extracellular solute-binding protein [Spirochaetales bacterium]